jgi:hypothetical protein
MTRRLWALALTLAGCGLLAGLSPAADDKKDAPKDDQPAQAQPDERGDDVAQIGLASQLEHYGRHSEPRSPLALITAASILRHIKPAEGTEKPKVEGGSGEEARPEAFDPDVLVRESDRLLNDAVRMARNDQMIKDLASRVAEGKTRGGLNGPMEYHMTLRRGQTDTYNLKFKKNAWVRIAIRQEGDANLYVEVQNANHDVRATDAGHNPVVGFMPHGNDGTDYIIKVKNTGPGSTYYFLFTN